MIGAVVGSIVETSGSTIYNYKLTRKTLMIMALYEAIKNKSIYDKSNFIDNLFKWCTSYGKCIDQIIISGLVIGWYARDLKEIKDLSNELSQLTNVNKEENKDMLVLSKCIYYARNKMCKDDLKIFVDKSYSESFGYSRYRNIIIQAIQILLLSVDFEDALKLSLGKSDKILKVIVGGLAEAYYKHIDLKLIKKVYEVLPDEMYLSKPKKTFIEMLELKLERLTLSQQVNEETKVISITEDNELSFIYGDSIEAMCNYISLVIFEDTDIDEVFSLNTVDKLNEYVKANSLNYTFKYIDSIEEAIGKYKRTYNLYTNNLVDILNQKYTKRFE